MFAIRLNAESAAWVALLPGRIDPGGRLLLAVDDTPTKRYGPQVHL